jgi:hypothetical protein
MFNRSTFSTLAVALGLVATIAGCGRTNAPVAGRSLVNAEMQARAAQAAHEDSPCDHDIASLIDVRAPLPRAVRIPAMMSLTGRAPKPEMLSIPSPNKSGRGGQDIDTLVMHHTSSTANAERIAGFFSQPSAKVSAHYVVGKDGTIVTCVPDGEASWHAGVSSWNGKSNVNGFSIGIEI